MNKICALCGDTFDTDHPRQKYCRKQKVGRCIVCGKEYAYICEKQHSTTCGDPNCAKLASSKISPHRTKVCVGCGRIFVPKSYRSSYCGEIISAVCSICGRTFQYECKADAVRDRCPNCTHLYTKTCIYCGKEFVTSSPQKQVCDGVHYKICPVCGKKFIADNRFLYKDMCCSDECANVRRGTHIRQVLSTKPKGYNAPKTFYTHICKICGEPFTTSQKAKVICDRPHNVSCEICGKSFTATYNQILAGRRVCSQTCASNKSRRTFIGDDEVFFRWQEFIADPEVWIRDRFGKDKPTYRQLNQKLKMSECTISQRLQVAGLSHLVRTYVSTMEQEVMEFIHTQNAGIRIVHNDRTILKPKEIDIYLPELNLGIECNPTCSHNSSRSSWIPGFYGVPNNYHRDKSIQAADQGVFLFHLFGYEWTHKREIMESIIRNLINCNSRKLYARNCELKYVPYREACAFLDHNHRQGYGSYKYCYGLYYQQELVSVMTFSPPRHTISAKGDSSWELVRFCSKINCKVVGAASRLFQHFIADHPEIESIRSFSDVARTRGALYSQLGFEVDHISSPGYVWVNTSTDEAVNRIKAQKRNICKLLKDPNIDLAMSESQIMEEHGFVKVYDSGAAVWRWNRPHEV